ncbi:serine/threonine protein kinase [Nocardioides mangrovicus]|uniref:non-specific serine/threonine protein kinase n=1 Tax=Nocardioides mangrovicus TaxID=2478913 RepID=A0A3L8P5S0_9ACTN|nr:serine/threonine-protein kinase [Nocardioides mangrovicus]RLV49758.1 serine/threonine protein kinase [Nocardioides mangrovicus]
MTLLIERADVDDVDGLPVWGFEAGEELVPGARALERLGVGHRCETWLAWWAAGWHPVVVKLARPHQRDHPRARAALRREVDAALPHPHLARLLVDGSNAPLPFVVTEYLDGPTVADVVDDQGAFTFEDAATLGSAVLSALRALHRAGLAHLDVKAENVVLRDGRPYLIDAGSARPLGRTQPPGRPVGTPGYTAPEMEACSPVAAAMDRFGLGTLLAEALTGTPFPEAGRLPDVALAAVVRRLLDADPLARGTDESILGELAELTGEDRPWPTWADADLA